MMAFDTQPPPQNSAVLLVHDARATYDAASLEFELFVVQGKPTWVVAIVVPDSASGSATVPGAYINGETGEIVTPQQAQSEVVKKGQWRVLASSDPTGPPKGSYSWSEPLTEKRKLTPEDYYSPFVSGGTILFPVIHDAAGNEQFGPVHLLFAGWEQYAASAFMFVSQHPALVGDGRLTSAEASQLTHLLTEKNKLLVVLAFRRLIASNRIDVIQAKNVLTNSDSDLTSICTYLVLANGSNGPPEISQQPIAISRATHDTNKLRSIALGAFTTGLFHPEEAGSRATLVAVRQRLQALGVPIERDAYLASMFEKMGM